MYSFIPNNYLILQTPYQPFLLHQKRTINPLITKHYKLKKTKHFPYNDYCPQLLNLLTHPKQTTNLTLKIKNGTINKNHVNKTLQPIAHFIKQNVPFNKHLNIQIKFLQPNHCILQVPFQNI